MTKEQIISAAKAELGTKESPANSNNVKYNTWYYGKSVSGSAYPWCAVFVSWLFKNEQSLCRKTASCVEMLSWFEQKGQTVKNPQAGDIVFFKYSTNNRKTNHVGLVVDVNGKTITTIEGNTSTTSNDNGGAVMQRTRKANIVAYARPRYSNAAIILNNNKSKEDIAKEVIAGKWGSGNDRRQRLTKAGYDYKEIQSLVNQILKK